MIRLLQSQSDSFGWGYFLSWAFSNYPTIIHNYRRKSVAGFSFNYQIWNLVGFLFYMQYVIFGFYYQNKLNITQSIHVNDISFSINAFLSSCIQTVQCFIYPNGKQKLHITNILLCAIMVSIAIYNVFLGYMELLPWYSISTSPFAYSVIQYLGLIKLFITVIKYAPQVLMNYYSKSTDGWAITNSILDANGSVLCISQMVVDAYANPLPDNTPDWDKIFGNIPKLFLAIISFLFDCILFIQHYIQYYKEVNIDNTVADTCDVVYDEYKSAKVSLTKDVQPLDINTILKPYISTNYYNTNDNKLTINSGKNKYSSLYNTNYISSDDTDSDNISYLPINTDRDIPFMVQV